MGSGLGWRCKSCGAREEYWTGCGMASFDVAETLSLIAKGEFGVIAERLLADDFPLDVHTIDEQVFYRCPGCGKLMPGMIVRFRADDAFEMVLPVPPEKCPECDGGFIFRDERTPVSDGEIAAYVDGILRSGCPECGSKEIEPTMVMWD